jgi:hypothetical protein
MAALSGSGFAKKGMPTALPYTLDHKLQPTAGVPPDPVLRRNPGPSRTALDRA